MGSLSADVAGRAEISAIIGSMESISTKAGDYSCMLIAVEVFNMKAGIKRPTANKFVRIAVVVC